MPATLEVLLCADSSSDCTGPSLLFCRGDRAPFMGNAKRTTPVVSVLLPSMGAGSSITQQMCWAARLTMWVPSQTGWRSQAACSRAMPQVSDAQRGYLTTTWPTAASPTSGKVDTRQWQYGLLCVPRIRSFLHGAQGARAARYMQTASPASRWTAPRFRTAARCGAWRPPVSEDHLMEALIIPPCWSHGLSTAR